MEKAKISTVSMSAKFENFQPINNSGFVRGVCKVAYAGKNRNYSNILKTAFEKAEPTVFGIPVVGNWLGDNYGGHDVLIETKGNEISIKDNTTPFGFVPQDANPRWETVEDADGNSKNYHVVDVILWQERYPEQVQFVIDNGANQSMEIMVKDGEWDENFEYFNINDFYYSALCLLGRDVDENGEKGEDDVEPCFEQSEVIVNKFNMTEKFKKDLFAIKSAFQGGENLDNIDKTKVNNDDFAEDKISEDLLMEDFIKENKNIFELSHDDIRGKIFNVLNPIGEDGYRQWNYWIMEVFQTYVVVVDENEFDKYYRFDYSIDDSDELTLSNQVEIFIVYLTQEEKDTLEQQKNDFTKLQEDYCSLESEIVELREFKQDELKKQERLEKDELIKDYSLLLDSEVISEMSSEIDKFTKEELRIKLAEEFANKELEKAKSKAEKTKADETIIFDNKQKDNKTKKNKFAI